MNSTVTSKGQVTIPKSVRVFLKIKPRDRVAFSIENGKVVLKSIRTLKDLRGSVPARKKGSLEAERQQAKAVVGRKVVEEMQ